MAEIESTISFPRLGADNYTTWKVDMRVLLMDRNCWEFIEENPVLKEKATEKEERSFNWRKTRAYTSINLAVERQYQELIADTSDGKKAWNILKDNFEPKTRARLAGLIDEFFELRYSKDETIGLFCKRIQQKRLQIKESGFDLPEILTCFQMIRRLPAEYDGIVQTLYRLDDEKFTATNLEKELISESGRINQRQKDLKNESVSNAFNTSRARSQVQREKSSMCSGSILDPEAVTNRREKFSGNCHYCGRKGHLMKNCYKKKNTRFTKQEYRKDENERNRRNDAFYSETQNHKGKYEVEEVLMTSASEEKLEEWLLDSAATQHFCTHRDWFLNYRKINIYCISWR